MSRQSLLDASRELRHAIDVIHALLIAADDRASPELKAAAATLIDRLNSRRAEIRRANLKVEDGSQH